MKKSVSLLILITLVISFVSCSNPNKPASTNSTTPKSAELSAQYNFYTESVKKIQDTLKITPEQADEVFIVLTSFCGLDGEIRNIYAKSGEENTYSYYWEGSASTYSIVMTDCVVSQVLDGSIIKYPLEQTPDTINAKAVQNVTTLIENLSADSTRAEYEAAQTAYDDLTNSLKKQISDELKNKLTEYNFSTMTLEQAVDYAIETARAEKIDIQLIAQDNKLKGVSIYLKCQDNLTNNLIRSSVLLEAEAIIKNLQSRNDIKFVCMFWSGGLVDTYGNTSEKNVFKININAQEIKKINFENFDYNNIPQIADEYYVHAAYKD